jgi:DNA-binding NarL/FixJ family response regulator
LQNDGTNIIVPVMVGADYALARRLSMNTSTEVAQLISTQVLRIMVADDHDLVRQGLRSMLEAQPGWMVCGEATTGREAVDLAQQLQPDIVVIDVHMPEVDGLQATREILAANPQTEVLILTVDETREIMQEAKEVGARGIVMKTDAALDLVAAVAALAQHESFYTPKASQILLQHHVHPLGVSSAATVRLSERERDVVVLVAEGLGNKQVGATLGISVKTVESHRRNIMRKLGLKSSADLVRYAVRDGLVRA